MFLKNVWQVAAFAAELKDRPLPRTLLGEQVVMFRGPDGRPAALLDECPHRLAPLSLGRVVDGVLQCGYHGMAFNGQGACVRVPGRTAFPPRRWRAAFRWSSGTLSSGFGWATLRLPTKSACLTSSG